jgi:hypothetical protein
MLLPSLPILSGPSVIIYNLLSSVEKIMTSAIKQSKEFDVKTRLSLTPHLSKMPHIYSLVKVHKACFPFRLIVSGIVSPSQHLARYLLPILNSLVGKTQTCVKCHRILYRKKHRPCGTTRSGVGKL